LVAASTADRKFIHRDDPTIARATTNIAGSIKPAHQRDAACRSQQEAILGVEATALRYIDAVYTQDIEGCTLVVLPVVESGHSMHMSVGSHRAEWNAALPGIGQVLDAHAK